MNTEKVAEIVRSCKVGNISCEEAAIRICLLKSLQFKAFADYCQKRMWEDGDKDLSKFVDEFLSL